MEGFIRVKLKDKNEKLRNFRLAYFFKECLSLYLTRTAPVPLRQAFSRAFFFPFPFIL